MDPMTILALVGQGLNIAQNISNLGSSDSADQTKIQIAQTKSNISAYQDFLNQFPAYSKYMTTEYQAGVNKNLGQMSANFGAGNMAATGMSGGTTSASLAYGNEKSLYDQGYTQLTNQLQSEQKQAKQQLGVYQTTLDTLNKKLGEQQHPVGTFFKNLGSGLTKIGDSFNLNSLFGKPPPRPS